MGRDKALLAWRGTDLLDHTLDRLREVCAQVAILGGVEARYGDRCAPIHLDLIPDAGALGGVYAGLVHLQRPYGLFLAVDLPLVPVALLRRLIELAPDHDAVVPVSPAGPEPLCAVYARSCREPVARRLAAGELKMTAFWPDVRVREVSVAELAAFGDPGRLFLNVNSMREYEDASARDRSSG